MEFNEYQELSKRTALYNQPDKTYILMYLGMGLAGESGEVVEKLKHVIRDRSGELTDEKRELLKKEIGDVFWYLSQIATQLDVSLNDIAQLNITKLADRLTRGVIKAEGDMR